MQLPRTFFFVAIFLAAVPARADITIACGGYSPAINDYVEWDLKIAGTGADRSGEHFNAAETKNSYILTRPGTEIRINKRTKSYVIYGPDGPKAPATEWSRKVPGEGCDIPKLGSQP